MNGFLWTLWVLVIIAIAIWAFGGVRRRRLRAFKEAAEEGGFTGADWVHLKRHVRSLEDMPEELKKRLEVLTLVLMAEKNFEACGGLEEVTREMKLVIMAQAAFLLLGRDHDFFPKLRTVLVYPEAYRGRDRHGEEEDGGRLGESWGSGTVVLSWKSVQRGGENDEDGTNVVIHEFAHQLDQENQHADGLPELAGNQPIGRWASTFSEAYEAFCEDLEAGRRTVMDPYGATNPAEFFAVASETFFEKPKQLKREEAALYEQLQTYYGVDPSTWS
ncbi:M90 family metallopeptidase [Verrucomicrobiaceae bacterium 227]